MNILRYSIVCFLLRALFGSIRAFVRRYNFHEFLIVGTLHVQCNRLIVHDGNMTHCHVPGLFRAIIITLTSVALTHLSQVLCFARCSPWGRRRSSLRSRLLCLRSIGDVIASKCVVYVHSRPVGSIVTNVSSGACRGSVR